MKFAQNNEAVKLILAFVSSFLVDKLKNINFQLEKIPSRGKKAGNKLIFIYLNIILIIFSSLYLLFELGERSQREGSLVNLNKIMYHNSSFEI